MTMLLSILLGTGIPTIRPTSSPPRWRTGLGETRRPLIVSHMFAFYYGIMAPLAAGGAGSAGGRHDRQGNPDKIGWEAMRIALAATSFPSSSCIRRP